MPIPFHDVDDVDELGAAGFLKVEPLPGTGAVIGLFVVNARGEPLEFAFNRLELTHPFLWTERLARAHLERRLVTSVLSVCSHNPRLLLCLVSELDETLLGRDLRLEVPLARITPPAHVSWQPTPPDKDSMERRLFDRLSAGGLLVEPFERASVGLREVYGNRGQDQG